MNHNQNSTLSTRYSLPSGQLHHEIFRAYDIRGIYPEALNEATVFAIGRVLGSRLISHLTSHPRTQQNPATIAIGRDGRHSGSALSDALVNGIRLSGVDVIDIGQAPTPVIYYVGLKHAHGSCIAITGSHNPTQYNGLKMVLNGETLATEDITSIISDIEMGHFCGGHFYEGTGKYSYQPELIDEYLNDIKQQSNLLASNPLNDPDEPHPGHSYHVVIDAGNGVSGPLAKQLFSDLGYKVTCLYCDIDGDFPNHHPDPSQPKNLQSLIHKVTSLKADLGIAFDGDGDRIGVIDSEGQIINADRLMMVYAQQVLENQPINRKKTILFDVKCTAHLPRWISKIWWRTDHVQNRSLVHKKSN